jgi:glycosyltransferase involved in cell wall biosynthesis
MTNRLPLTCGYITKNEGQFLEASLRAICPYIEELIIFDSGSTDETLKIAEKFRGEVPGFKIKNYTWKNDFSAARNDLANEAKHRWILFIDGDEVIDEKGIQQISAAVKSESADCYSLIQRNYTLDSSIEGAKLVSDKNLPGLNSAPTPLYFFDNWMERLYRRDRGLKYEGRIHESLLPTCRKLNLKHATLPAVLHHYGRLKTTQVEKAEYYLKLTEQKVKEEPANVVAVIELITNLIELKKFDEAFVVARDGLKKFPSISEMLKSAFQAALRADEFSTAETWIRSYLAKVPNDAFALSQLTTALLYQKKFSETLKLAEDLLQRDPQNFVAHVNCSVIYFEKQDWINALHHINAALQTKPHDLFLQQAREKVSEKMTSMTQMR